MVGSVVDLYRYARLRQFDDVGAAGADLFVVGDDANGHPALVGREYFVPDAVVGDGEDADIERSFGPVKEAGEFVEALVVAAAAEVRAGPARLAGVFPERANNAGQPIDDLARIVVGNRLARHGKGLAASVIQEVCVVAELLGNAPESPALGARQAVVVERAR